MFIRACLIAVSGFFVIACQSVPEPQDLPALIADANDTNRAALQQAVNAAIGTEVLLADSAFTERNILVIERRPRATLDNPVPDGRTMAMPIRLQLVLNGDQCILIDTRDGSRHPLAGARCVTQ